MQNILLRSKRNERTPLEIEVSELVAAKLITPDAVTSMPALQMSLKQDLNSQNELLKEAVESEKRLQMVVKIIVCSPQL